MKVTVQGQGQVTLLQSDFVAAGGEGSIYCKGTTAYKIYADPKRMLPLGKMTELRSRWLSRRPTKAPARSPSEEQWRSPGAACTSRETLSAA